MNEAAPDTFRLPVWVSLVIGFALSISECVVMVLATVIAFKAGPSWWETIGLLSIIVVPSLVGLYVILRVLDHLKERP